MRLSKIVAGLIISFVAIGMVTGGVLSVAPQGAVAQQGEGVTTPTPSGGASDPYDCGDFDNAQQVRAVFDPNNDESDLDRDDDNIPCEGDFPDQGGPVTAESTATSTATATSTPTETATETATATNTETETTTQTETPETTTETTTETTEAETEQPTASVNFENQSTDGTTVVVDSVTMSEGGFVAIHNASLLNGNTLGSVVGVSDHLSAGTHKNVEVTLFDVPGQGFSEDMSLGESQKLIAMPHLDTNSNGVYDFITSNGSEDGPYTENGSAVIDPASVTVNNETTVQNETAYYQVDFVSGEPIENLRGPNGTYSNGQLIRFAHGSSDQPITRRSEGEFTTNDTLADRIESQNITVENDTATTTFTVSEGDSVTLSLVSYTKPGPHWSPQTEHLQKFIDADTETFGPGTHTLTVELPTENDSEV